MRDLIDLMEKMSIDSAFVRPDTGNENIRWYPNERRGQWTTSLRLSNGRTVGLALFNYEQNADTTLQVNADKIIVGDKTFTRDGYDAVGRIVLGTLLKAAQDKVSKRIVVASADADLSRMLKQLMSRIGPMFQNLGYKTNSDGIVRVE